MRDRHAAVSNQLDVSGRQPDPVREHDPRREEPDRVHVLDERLAVHAPARDRLHPRLEHVDVDHELELVGKSRAPGEHLVRAALGARRPQSDRDPLVRPVEALDRLAAEPLPLVPGRRPLGFELLDELAQDETLLQDHRLVVGAVADPESDQRAQARVAVAAHDGLERLGRETVELVEEVDDAGRARPELLQSAEHGAQVDLLRPLRWRRQRRVREQHPGLERQVVPHAAEPVLVRVVVRVDHPGHDEEARAVDDLRIRGRLGDDPAAGNGDVGADELTRTDVGETVSKDEVRQAPASVATSAIASVGMASSGTVFGKPSQLRTGPKARTSATSPK